MDTSKEYILMCEKAGEIQEYGHIKSEKWEKEHYPMLPESNSIYRHLPTKENPARLVWLPRQDQLQEMIDYPFPAQLVQDFANWCSENHYYGIGKGKKFKLLENLGHLSMEQLWLAFVMKEKYQKTWNGKEWVK
ncbi:hypothetical protein LCGC14_2213010 [marine sediment metagenome]|uniref:Uncharacterized protein n=1 Tax=marine sediment metagenome TaxID=412755 RepID=A0A0F9E0P4_9ZZZZ